MRTTVLALAAATALAAPAAAAGGTGPYAGQVSQGQTQTHTYDNNPSGNDCIQLAVPYEVTLRWAGGTVTLAAGGQSVTDSDGAATLYVTRGWCTSFDVSVTAAAGDATYVLTVNRQLLPAVTPELG